MKSQLIREAIKKKNYQTLDIVQTSTDPFPIRQVWSQKVWTLRLGSDNPPTPHWALEPRKVTLKSQIWKIWQVLAQICVNLVYMKIRLFEILFTGLVF